MCKFYHGCEYIANLAVSYFGHIVTIGRFYAVDDFYCLVFGFNWLKIISYNELLLVFKIFPFDRIIMSRTVALTKNYVNYICLKSLVSVL